MDAIRELSSTQIGPREIECGFEEASHRFAPLRSAPRRSARASPRLYYRRQQHMSLIPVHRRAICNSAKNFRHSGVLALSMLSAIPAIGEVTALDRYVAAPDPNYHYELIETIPGDGYAAHVLEITSQRWRDEAEVDRPLWKHWLTIIEPGQVATSTGLLIVGGGSNERKAPARVNPLLAMGAV